tara:strand:+ start:698 stop:904 length:207 start_codon:yes stop_codon:yes gene_type:complete
MQEINKQITIDASTLPDVKCPKCESLYFKNLVRIKKVSALVSPTGSETLMPIPVIACAECGHVIRDVE